MPSLFRRLRVAILRARYRHARNRCAQAIDNFLRAHGATRHVAARKLANAIDTRDGARIALHEAQEGTGCAYRRH